MKLCSLWREGVSLPRFEQLDGTLRADVLVIGGGMAGLLCARLLTDAGVDTVLLEAETIGSGVTGNTTAKLSVQHGLVYHSLLRRFGAEKARLYYDANRAALDAFRALCAGISCGFEEKDSYIYSLDRPERLEKELKALDSLGIPGDYAEDLPLPFPTVGAVRLPGQAQFHPLMFLAAIAPGLRIFEHSRVVSVDGGSAFTPRGRVDADSIIVCTHFPFMNLHGSYFLKLYQSRSYAAAYTGAGEVDGIYLDERSGGFSLRSAGDALIVGHGGHRPGRADGGWQPIETLVQGAWPGARELCRWAAQDCMSLDGVPYAGPYSASTPRLFVASGFNKWGMTGSMASALLLTDLVRGLDHPWAELFSPSRTMLRPQLAVNGIQALAGWLTPTTRRCPHLGCALVWNPREHSWDCPCHGSRFGEDGKLLDNPANGDRKTGK